MNDSEVARDGQGYPYWRHDMMMMMMMFCVFSYISLRTTKKSVNTR